MPLRVGSERDPYAINLLEVGSAVHKSLMAVHVHGHKSLAAKSHFAAWGQKSFRVFAVIHDFLLGSQCVKQYTYHHFYDGTQQHNDKPIPF
jgi:hypothetical protein